MPNRRNDNERPRFFMNPTEPKERKELIKKVLRQDGREVAHEQFATDADREIIENLLKREDNDIL